MSEDLIGIVFFASIPAAIWAVSHYRFKSRKAMAETVQKIAESGQSVDAEMVKTFGMPQKRPHADLRTGMIALAIGLAFILAGGAIPDDEATVMMAAMGMFPILIGLALIAFWFFVDRKRA